MPEEGFLRRWARVKASGADAVAEAPQPALPAAAVPLTVAEPGRGAPPAGEAAAPVPTLEDAAQLTPASDFSAFVSQGVDQDVRRLALKKLFADPHFNVLDRLDMYMDDYNKPDPVSATMLAALEHARGTLRRPEEVQAELARLAARDRPPEAAARVLEAEPAEAPVPVPDAAAAEEAQRAAVAADGEAAVAALAASDAGPAGGAGAEASPAQAGDPAAPPDGAVALAALRAHNVKATP